jgi:hypothetical protein
MTIEQIPDVSATVMREAGESMPISLVERIVIGSLMLDSRYLRDATSQCTPADFFDQQLGEMFAGIASMYANREPIDVLTVSDHLQEWSVRFGAEDLHSWTSEVPTAASVGYYAAIVRRASMRRELRAVATRLNQAASKQEVQPGDALEAALGELRDVREGHMIEELTAVPLSHVLHTTDTEYDWVIQGLLERRDRFMLTGGEGGGKTTFMRQLAITAAAGIHPFYEYPIPPARVLVVDAENTEKQWARETRKWAHSAEQLEADDPYKNFHLSTAKRMDLTRDMDLGKLHRLVDSFNPDVLFIGPLYRLTRGAINNDDDAAPLLAALDTLRDRGLALVIEAHAGHAANPRGERDLRPRGSSALLGWPEFGYGLRRNSKNPLHVDMVKWRGDRDARGWPAKLGRSQNPGAPGSQRWPWRPVE